MIQIWITAFVVLGLMWLVWDPLGDVVVSVLTFVNTRYPGYLDTNTVAFIQAYDTWFPVLVLLGVLLYVLVSSQRTEPVGYM